MPRMALNCTPEGSGLDNLYSWSESQEQGACFLDLTQVHTCLDPIIGTGIRGINSHAVPEVQGDMPRSCGSKANSSNEVVLPRCSEFAPGFPHCLEIEVIRDREASSSQFQVPGMMQFS